MNARHKTDLIKTGIGVLGAPLFLAVFFGGAWLSGLDFIDFVTRPVAYWLFQGFAIVGFIFGLFLLPVFVFPVEKQLAKWSTGRHADRWATILGVAGGTLWSAGLVYGIAITFDIIAAGEFVNLALGLLSIFGSCLLVLAYHTRQAALNRAV